MHKVNHSEPTATFIDGVLYLKGPLSQKHLVALSTHVKYGPTVSIDGLGGEISIEQQITKMIRCFTLKTQVPKLATSAGSAIFASGIVRTTTQEAEFLFHLSGMYRDNYKKNGGSTVFGWDQAYIKLIRPIVPAVVIDRILNGQDVWINGSQLRNCIIVKSL